MDKWFNFKINGDVDNIIRLADEVNDDGEVFYMVTFKKDDKEYQLEYHVKKVKELIECGKWIKID